MSKVSPFFVLEAEQMILAEFYEDAIELCKTGLDEYPEYISAWTILARAFKMNGDLASALQTIKESQKNNPENKVIKSLFVEFSAINLHDEKIQISEIDSMFEDVLQNESIEGNNNDLEIPKREFKLKTGFLTNYISSTKVHTTSSDTNVVYDIDSILHKTINTKMFERQSFRDIIIPELVEINTPLDESISQIEIPKTDEFKSPFDSKLADLAKKLEEVSNPRHHAVQEEVLNEEKDSKPTIVTETMANIYLQQGAFEEATKAFKELMKLNPDKKDYFLSKLKTLAPKTK